MIINRISIGRMTIMFSFYFNFNINVLPNIWESINFTILMPLKNSEFYDLVFVQCLKRVKIDADTVCCFEFSFLF